MRGISQLSLGHFPNSCPPRGKWHKRPLHSVFRLPYRWLRLATHPQSPSTSLSFSLGSLSHCPLRPSTCSSSLRAHVIAISSRWWYPFQGHGRCTFVSSCVPHLHPGSLRYGLVRSLEKCSSHRIFSTVHQHLV